jgi:hypothetical protein
VRFQRLSAKPLGDTMTRGLSRPIAAGVRIALLLLGLAAAGYAFLGVWMTAEFSFFAKDAAALHQYSVRAYQWLAGMAVALAFSVWQVIQLYRERRRASPN